MDTDVRAVLLDMDGTLVDSDAAVERSWRAWGERNGMLEEVLAADLHGFPARVMIRRLAPHLSDEEVALAVESMVDIECADLDGVTATQGARELLDVLTGRGLPWAVVTGAGTRLARARLGAAGIEPPLLVSVDDVTRAKPDPEAYLHAAALLGVAPAGCLVVEDSAPGIAAGRAAGMTVAALRGLPADLPIAHLGELADTLRRQAPAATA
ncbi:HAD-IA family hydrolase [Sphaerisporangium fuscum]|uniref:HAD-IA family hydrolase n=1 Tax=Sphaerisporangium fuscum TaxID=2835868 RepID=UPI001BDCB4F7|nr:HAD-IA family hydrolase [Sphaerisporangium fuscum]